MIKLDCDEYGNDATTVALGQVVIFALANPTGSSLTFGHELNYRDEKNAQSEIVRNCYICNLVCCVSINEYRHGSLTAGIVSECQT